MVAAIGFLTDPHFGDGLFHLEIARTWYVSGDIPAVIFNLPCREPVLWYFLVKTMSYITNGNIHLAAQLVQMSFYAGILTLIYLLTRMQTKSDLIAKCAIIFTGTLPMLTVPAILCFIDIGCAFFVTLSIYLLLRQKYFLAILACTGVWYSKRTGILALIPFFPAFSYFIFTQKKYNIKATFIELIKYAAFFLLTISPSIFSIFSTVGFSTTFALNYNVKKEIVLVHNGSAVNGLPIYDTLVWTGGILAFLTLLMIAALLIRSCRKVISGNWKRYAAILFIFLSTITIINLFPLGRVTVRYCCIVMPLGIICLTGMLFKTKFKAIIILLTVAAIIQQATVLTFVFDKRRLLKSDIEALNTLVHISSKKKIVWDEINFGSYYLKKNIVWEKELLRLLSNNSNMPTQYGDIGAIVITKRFLYYFKDKYYDRGVPYSLFDKLKQDQKLDIVLDNKKYCIFFVTGNDKKKSPVTTRPQATLTNTPAKDFSRLNI